MHPLVKKVEVSLRNNDLLPPGSHVVVGLSGGADSIALCLILKELEWDILAAHVNYGLRGEESDADEQFVRQFCAKKGIALEVKKVDTLSIAESDKKGIQEIAREIRYSWFRELANKFPGALIATGHHADDQAETVLFQLLRGTGIKGLAGMKSSHNGLIRPLLEVRRLEIEEFLQEQAASWRTDSSNDKDDYSRNFIRHHILPLAEKVNEKAVEHILQTSQIAEEYRLLAEAQIEEWFKQNCIEENEMLKISIEKLRVHPQQKSVVWYVLERFGFGAGTLHDVLSLMDSESGKGVRSENYEVQRDRDFLILKPLSSKKEVHIHISSGIEKNQFLEMHEVSGPIDFTAVSDDEAYFDANKLNFPLLLRNWKTGDRFRPLGMKGQQKISDLLIQNKVPLFIKQDVLVLESNGKIIWVLGFRVSEDAKISADTTHILQFRYIETS